MGIFARAVKSFDVGGMFGTETIQAGANSATVSGILRGAARNRVGTSVQLSDALSVSSFFAAVKAISEDVAKLPLHTYREGPDGVTRAKAKDDPTYRVLHTRANPAMAAWTWKQVTVAHALTWGDAFSLIVRDGAGRLAELWPMAPDRVAVALTNTGRLAYQFTKEDGGTVALRDVDVLHVPGISFDGIKGYSVLRLAANALGLAIAAEEWPARAFANEARPGIIIKVPGKLSKQARAEVREEIMAGYTGSKRGAALVLQEGMDATTLAIPMGELQLLEQRKFSVTEVARFMRITPHKLQDLERATFSNIEHQAIEYVGDTIMPWTTRIEAALAFRVHVTPKGEPTGLFSEFLMDAALRADAKSRAEALSIQRQNGVINADEWRALENLGPIKDGGGTAYLAPTALAAINADGMTYAQRVSFADRLIARGADPVETLAAFGLPALTFSTQTPATAPAATA